MFEFDTELIRSLDRRTYWEPTKVVCDRVISELTEQSDIWEAHHDVMNHLYQIMWDSSEGVGRLQKVKIRAGELEDAGQSNVSVAGHNFQALVAYCLERNRIIGNIPYDIVIALRPLKHPMIRDYATIHVGGGESQRPDVDILIYTEDEDTPLLICSCKTSLRERAGQTYRWKLLLDMARCNCEHEPDCPMSRYNLHYESDKDILVALITADFYDEREGAQQRGMFTFFDYVYISKQIEEFANVQRLSNILAVLNEIF
jgi:type II restriction enzyme